MDEHGPRGCRIGDVIVAEGVRWLVVDLDHERREAICRLQEGAHTLRRFRARRILSVERTSPIVAGSALEPAS